MKEPVIGIDLGTRYSLVSYCPPGGVPRVLPNRWGKTRTPSYVAYRDGRFLCGDDALRGSAISSGDMWWDIKRKLGTDWVARCGGRAYGAEDLLSHLLCLLREDAEASLGSFVTSAVITVPAHFGFPERGALYRSAKGAGFEFVRVLNEPTAAALSVASDGRFLILDFGGGTLDISVLEGEDGVFQVLDSLGRKDLGGYDLDRRLAVWLWRHLGSVPLDEVDPRWLMVLREAEQVKIALSDVGVVDWVPPWGFDDTGPLRVTREDLEGIIAPVVDEVVRLTERLFRRHRPDRLVVVGGSGRIPLLRRRLSERVGPIEHMKVCPDEAVALGASLFIRQGGQRLLIDVLSASVGVVLKDGSVRTLVHRGSPLPAEASSSVSLDHLDGAVTLVQGEGVLRGPSGSRVIYRVPVPSGETGDVRLSLVVDTGGLLRVKVMTANWSASRVVDLALSGGAASFDLERELREREARLAVISMSASRQVQDRLLSMVGKVRRLSGTGQEGLAMEALDVLDRLILDMERVLNGEP
ncbi:molecular chaperone [Thermanaerovibrio velox DSM 12556]|uniref:Molecular chaperone n=1 Tax=Thermanaerovibrio velox DSM 12556 TaxID=926567 RepID=H0USK6_9BACT|nr:Hsp70 family protein [Thermanaerovibrio velox]EHM10295.1 molecular chaperone [Thermanaerovibrio velox DSM 12556]